MTSSPGSTRAISAKDMTGLAPGVTTTCSGLDLDPPAPAEVGRDGLAEAGHARRGRVVRVPVSERRCAASTMFARRVEVGLAEVEVDDVAAALRPAPVPGPPPRTQSRCRGGPCAAPASWADATAPQGPDVVRFPGAPSVRMRSAVTSYYDLEARPTSASASSAPCSPRCATIATPSRQPSVASRTLAERCDADRAQLAARAAAADDRRSSGAWKRPCARSMPGA